MLIKKPWSRRRFLEAAGIGAGAATLSWLLPGHLASAGGTTPKKRLVLFSTPDGSNLARWRSNEAGAAFRSGDALPALMGPMLSPLDRHRSRLTLLDGIDLSPVYDPRGPALNNGHSAQTVLWTGARRGGSASSDEPDASDGWPSGPSVDQILADRIAMSGDPTPIHSLYVGSIDPRESRARSRSAFRRVGSAIQPIDPIFSPRALHEYVFAASGAGSDTDTRRSDERRRSLALVRGEIGRLRAELPTEDRDRLEQHLAGLSAIESRLASGRTCSPPEAPASRGVTHEDATSLQFEIIKAALECDMTRVVSYTWGREAFGGVEGGGMTMEWLPGWPAGSVNLHGLTHETEDTSAVGDRAVDQVVGAHAWFAERLATFLDLLAATPDVDDTTLLDNTVVVWGAAMCHGGKHSSRNVPVVICGGDLARGYYRFGDFAIDDHGNRTSGSGPIGGAPNAPYVIDGNRPINQVLVSICHAIGYPDIDRVGTDAVIDATGGPGPLAEIMV